MTGSPQRRLAVWRARRSGGSLYGGLAASAAGTIPLREVEWCGLGGACPAGGSFPRGRVRWDPLRRREDHYISRSLVP